MIFSDIIYGRFELPDWLGPFIKSPEFSRLRGVRLSNVDSIQFKDFNNTRRWEHCIAVAHLALRLSKKLKLGARDTAHLTLAALFHDIATPPFAHTVEYIIENYSHETESQRILSATSSIDSNPSLNIFKSEIPQFQKLCLQASKKLNVKIDPDEIANFIVGEGPLGFFIKGSIDLDNIDNVTRASVLMGIEINRKTPYELINWLSDYQSAPTEIDSIKNTAVIAWLSYRDSMYRLFFESSDIELGRQALLQHILRRALSEGFPRKRIIWNTDEELLFDLQNYFDKMNQKQPDNSRFKSSMGELIYRYKLLEDSNKIAEVGIHDKGLLDKVKNPRFGIWLEQIISSPSFEPFVFINKKRYGSTAEDYDEMFAPNEGSILFFKLGSPVLKLNQLPEWIKSELPKGVKEGKVNEFFVKVIKSKLVGWSVEKPWLVIDEKRKVDITDNLNSVGEWSFRLSRNESLHSYPGTFVHAIPANLIMALGLKGEKIWDPFGGTGQTASEAVKLGCPVISSDSNTVASMVAKAKLSYLSKPDKTYLQASVTSSVVLNNPLGPCPEIKDLDKWHHPGTISELRRISGFIRSEQRVVRRDFLKTCFSDIIRESTERKGKEHGYFADNTPLPKALKRPQYVNAIELFIRKIRKNIAIIEKFYAEIERNELKVSEALANCNVFKFNIAKESLHKINIVPGEVAGIITSPPYLCMADYALGQRLSYYWLFPEDLEVDFSNEIGARRRRGAPTKALDEYLESMRSFAKNSFMALRDGGILATVIGVPEAKSFKDADLFDRIDAILYEEGFRKFWNTTRPINWHRNHGYSYLKSERVTVYTKQTKW